MSRKKRTPWKKRCHCREQASCAHPWWLRLKVKGGKQDRWNLTEMFPDDAVEIAAAKARTQARSGRGTASPPSAAPLTVRDVAKRFIAKRGTSYQLAGLLDARVDAANGTSVALGDKPIDAVTTRDVKAAREAWQRRRKNAGPNGERHFLQTARFFFNWAVKEEFATRTPFLSPQGKALITVKKSSKRSRRLEEGEEERIRAVGDPFVNDFLTAMLHTGCRPGELRTLQRSEVRERIVVLASKAKDREERRIPIRPEVQEVLDRRRKGPDGADLPPDTYVFGDDTGRIMSRERLCARWRATCATAKVENLHLHDLRGEFGSQLAESGVPLHQVRDALGHANISMTSTYLRSRTDSLDDAYAQLDRKKLKLVKHA
ncbi:MAG TPA: site-specific integrase [Vicinamibacterales bacterium]|nr:site-specific integrase [Vicinamibacterales bacterium]